MFFDKFRKKNKIEEPKEYRSGKFDDLKNSIIKLSKERLEKYNNSNYTNEQIEEFKRNINSIIRGIDDFIKNYDRCEENLQKYVINSEEYNKVNSDRQRWYYEIIKCSKMVEFMRPNTPLEIKKREEIYKTFGTDVQNILGDECELRFHGTPIYYAKDIIKTKSISGSADRYDGYIRSTDLKGEFSASSISSLDRTIHFFTDFGSDLHCLPCGVLFVLKEKESDFELRQYSTMHNINFLENPEQLQAIISTDENIENLNKWCLESGIDTSIIYTYDGYIEHLRNMKKL